MVSFEDSGTEAEVLSEQDDFSYEGGGRGRTKYTTCRYCKQQIPLRDISRHARVAHYEESTKYTDCRKCGVKFPLREIRMHARTCDGKPSKKAPAPRKIEGGQGACVAADSTTLSSDALATVTAQAQDVMRDQSIAYLRAIGYTVEKATDGHGLSGLAVDRFKRAWHAADTEGRHGGRVRAGRSAAREAMNLGALQLIDKTIDNGRGFHTEWSHSEVNDLLWEIRNLLVVENDRKCQCKAHSEDRGGWYSELVIEPERDCPEHGENA